MTTPPQMIEPPLLRFLRALDGDEKEAFAHAVGTTLTYLQQMVGNPAPNPNLKMALAMEAESHRLARQKPNLVPLSLQDLLVGRIKTKFVKNHATGEMFVMMPSGDLVRRRVDGHNRMVLVDQHDQVIAVEDSHPGPIAIKRTPRLESDE